VNRITSVSVVQSESELRSLCAGSKGAARRVWTRVDAQLCEATSPPPRHTRRGHSTVYTVYMYTNFEDLESGSLKIWSPEV